MSTQLSDEQRRQLAEQGFTLLRGVLDAAGVAALIERLEELWASEGEQAGAENYQKQAARRLANLANKGEIFRAVFAHPLVLAAGRAVVGPAIRVSMVNARDVPPGGDNHMPFHADTDRGGRPDEKGYTHFTAVWMLDHFTRQNGATRVVPGSHRSGLLAKEGMADLYHHPQEVAMEGQAGDVLIFNGHCWHTGGANVSGAARRAILVHYARADVPLEPNRRQHLSPEVAAEMTAEELELLDQSR